MSGWTSPDLTIESSVPVYLQLVSSVFIAIVLFVGSLGIASLFVFDETVTRLEFVDAHSHVHQLSERIEHVLQITLSNVTREVSHKDASRVSVLSWRRGTSGGGCSPPLSLRYCLSLHLGGELIHHTDRHDRITGSVR